MVYEALDREQGVQVALKRMQRADVGLYRFKREFRALADISHPNLVRLLELVCEDEDWFFTMELVEGQGFTQHVWEDAAIVASDTAPPSDRGSTAEILGDAAAAGEVAPVPEAAAAFHEERLRSALLQLAQGLVALHDAGKLHRDVKPSNVLVTRAGRVVILDFGLVTELRADSYLDSVDIVGTPAYMSPEQAAGLPVSEATDWYSVGAMLYECLTRRPPFGGTAARLLIDKQRLEPPPPAAIVAGVPDDLDALCVALLRRDPSSRPTGREVLRRLAADGPVGAKRSSRTTGSQAPTLVGREPQLAALRAAFEATRGDHTVVASILGPSGCGRTALVTRFVAELQASQADAVVLAGRCYERESAPYKALDGVVDALSRHLRHIDPAHASALLPRDIVALVRLFPVLRQVAAVSSVRRRVPEIPDSQERRRRAFLALRELLARMADAQPLVLFIDDLHWSDQDSVALLAELLRPPDAPAMLLICAHRTDQVGVPALLRDAFYDLHAHAARQVDVRDVVVGPLSPSESRALATQLLGGGGEALERLIDEIVRESGGSPYFIGELVHHYRSTAEAGEQALVPTLDRVIGMRLALLPAAARRLLEVIAVAGQPVEIEVADRVSGMAPEQQQEALAVLRAEHLVRARGTRARLEVECQHDRIRVSVLAGLSPEAMRASHEGLALALMGVDGVDAERLAAHFLAAGDSRNAAEYAVLAATRAGEALAFDRAARLYRLGLELHAPGEDAARRLRVLLGDALANAGRGGEAARAYLDAAAGAPAADRLELQRRAAEQLLISGHLDEGVLALGDVLRTVGMRIARTPAAALLSLVIVRGRLALRGVRFRERDPTQVAAADLMRIDTCWSIATSLAIIDTFRGAAFATRHLLLALEVGEPYRVARGLALEIGYSAAAGARTQARTERLTALTTTIADRLQQPHALALTRLNIGFAAYLQGRWRRARTLTEEAEAILRERCTGVTWERDTAQLNWTMAVLAMGDLPALSQRLGTLLSEAQERGDLYAATSLRTRISWAVHLAADKPREARADAREAIERWSRRGFHLQHLWEVMAQCEVDLYEGDGAAAQARLRARVPLLKGSLLMRIQASRVQVTFMRARAALSLAAAGSARSEQLARAARRARSLEGEGVAWAAALAQLVRGSVAALDGRRGEAAQLFGDAERSLTAVEMLLHAAAARRAQARLDGAAAGASAPDPWLEQQGIVRPDRLLDTLVPGSAAG